MSSLRDDRVHIPRLNALKFLQWKGARMVEEVGELELGDGLPEGKLQEPYNGVNELKLCKIQDGGKDALAILI